MHKRSACASWRLGPFVVAATLSHTASQAAPNDTSTYSVSSVALEILLPPILLMRRCSGSKPSYDDRTTRTHQLNEPTVSRGGYQCVRVLLRGARRRRREAPAQWCCFDANTPRGAVSSRSSHGRTRKEPTEPLPLQPAATNLVGGIGIRICLEQQLYDAQVAPSTCTMKWNSPSLTNDGTVSKLNQSHSTH
jgi:hypothetical protein